MNKDDALKKMSQYLLTGAEMLRDSCPDCQIPLLKDKKNGNVFCASCKKNFVIGEQSKDNTDRTSPTNATSEIFNSIESILLGKVSQLGNQISKKNTEDLNSELEMLNKILDILQKISNQKKGF